MSYYGWRANEEAQKYAFDGKIAGIVVGAKIVPSRGYDGMPSHEGAARWRLTDDLEALALPDEQFIPCASYAELVAALEERFPSDVPGLSRVSQMKGPYGPQADNGNRYGHGPRTDAIVHPRPKLSQTRWDADETWDYDRLQKAVTESGPVLVENDLVRAMREDGDWFESDLAFAPDADGCPGATSGYQYAKYNPIAAQGRRTRVKNDEARRERAKAVTQATYKARYAIFQAAVAVYRLVRSSDPSLCYLTEEPKDDDYRYQGQVYRSGSELDRYGGAKFDGAYGHARTLYHLCRVAKRYVGAAAYRRLRPFQEMREYLRDLPEGVKKAHLVDPGTEVETWLDAELKARKPPAKTEAADGEDAKPKSRARRRAAEPAVAAAG